jgi:anti-anti-sigma factor
MPIKSREFEHFVYILYNRSSKSDIRQLKLTIDAYAAKYNGKKDFIIDLTLCDEITSLEIGIIAKALSFVAETKRFLRMLSSDAVRKQLERSGLLLRKYAVLYKNTHDFLSELKKYQQHNELSALSKQDKIEEVVLSGRLDFTQVSALASRVTLALAKNCKQVVLNLKAVRFIDSVVLGQMMFLDGKAKELGKTIVLLAPQTHIMELFKNTSLDQIIKIVQA